MRNSGSNNNLLFFGQLRAWELEIGSAAIMDGEADYTSVQPPPPAEGVVPYGSGYPGEQLNNAGAQAQVYQEAEGKMRDEG